MVQHPIKFIRSPTFLWMWGTYAATYTTANTLRTIVPFFSTKNDATKHDNNNNLPPNNKSSTSTQRTQTSQRRPYSAYVSDSTTLLIGTSIVNSTASVFKDRAYAQLYGVTVATPTTGNHSTTLKTKIPSATTTTTTVPRITYGLWILRDLTVIGAAFVLPTHVAQYWKQQQQRQVTNEKGVFPNYNHHFSDATILRVSQIGTPVLAQVIAGPLHFIGYDCYNQRQLMNASPMSSSSSFVHQVYDRMINLRASLGQVITARMIRILPGYGIAGIFNTELLQQWKNHVVHPVTDWYQYNNNDRRVTSTTGKNDVVDVGNEMEM
jgi:hypothetical protein